MKICLTSILSLPFVAFAADTNALPALAPAYGELPPTFWEQHQTAIFIASFALLAFVFLFVKTMLRPESPKILPQSVGRHNLLSLVALGQGLTLASEGITTTQVPGVVYRPMANETLPYSMVWSSQNDNPAFLRLIELARSMAEAAALKTVKTSA